jgi:CDP-4-dehydro-6-deoxyglucose reductase/ferredoxin-NAD(P)+ reductase (naphthalene dioxygenase ferredoxin-specific)
VTVFNSQDLPFAGTVVELVQATADIRIVRVAVAGPPLSFQPGQFVSVGFGPLEGRDYSIASGPGEPELEFHVRDVGSGASRYAASVLQVGDRVRIGRPQGTAVLAPHSRRPILALAGGSGLAPIKSIVDAAAARAHPGPVHLYVGIRRPADLYLAGHFEALFGQRPGWRFVPVVAEPEEPGGLRTGLLPDVVGADFRTLAGMEAFLAGPPALVQALVPVLRGLGMAAVDIHADAFYTMGDLLRGAGAPPSS